MNRRDRFWFRLGQWFAALARCCFRQISEPIWLSFDGRVIPYSQMGDQHLINAIKMVERNGDSARVGPGLRAEATRRGLRVHGVLEQYARERWPE